MNTKTIQQPDTRIKLPAQKQLLAWAGVVFVALLSFFVYTVADGVDRGEQFRAALALGMPLAAQGR